MREVLNFFAENYVMLFELIGLLTVLKVSAHASTHMKRYTIAVIILLVVEAVAFYVEKWTQTFETLSIARPLLTATVYSIYPFVIIMLMQIISNKGIKNWQFIALMIPATLCVPIYYSSQWTQIVCYYSSDNCYHGGYISKLPYIVFGVYSLLYFLQNILYFRRYSKMNVLITTYIILGAILGVVIYMVTEYSSNYSALFTSSIVLYYLCLYIHLSKIDALTSLSNRHSFYQDINTGGDNIYAVISIDMNELKYINDNFGHDAGDKAIAEVAKVLFDYTGKSLRAYRVGGDEFIMLYFGTSEEIVISSIESMRKQIDKTSYSCAFGYSIRREKESIDELMKLADEMMYKNKKEMKKQLKEKGVELHTR